MAQTVSNGKRRILGSAKVEVATYGSTTFYDLGLGEGVAWQEGFKTEESIPDNGASLGMVILDQFADIDFAVWEPDLTALQLARGAIDNIIVTNGDTVSGYEQVIASGSWLYDVFIPFTGQNANGSKPTMDATHPALAATDGDLTENTDFQIVKVAGMWGIVIRDSAKVTTQVQNVTVKYTFTPAASLRLTTGGADVPGWLQLRLTNVTDGKNMVVGFYKVQNVTGFQLKMNSDSGTAKPNSWALKFHAVCDATRSTKDQLYYLDIQN